VPGAGGCRNKAHWSKSTGELATVPVAGADAVDSVGVTRAACSEDADRIPWRWCGRYCPWRARAASPHADAGRLTADAMHAGAICRVAVGITDSHDTGRRSSADAVDSVGVTRPGCSEDADRISWRWCGREPLATTAAQTPMPVARPPVPTTPVPFASVLGSAMPDMPGALPVPTPTTPVELPAPPCP
jgi:hypothetical protein